MLVDACVLLVEKSGSRQCSRPTKMKTNCPVNSGPGLSGQVNGDSGTLTVVALTPTAARCAAKPKKPRAAPKDDLARNTIAKLNIPAEMTNKEALQRVVEVLSAQGIRNVPSLSVIKRARAKKSMN
jgi:hypothetical protein